jgi:hypothetical protein
MLRAFTLVLAVSATLLCVVTPARAAHEDQPGEFSWSHAYTLTPLEYKRLRAIGLNEEEIAVAANTAHLSGRQYVDDVVQAILRGDTAYTIAARYGLAVSWITAEPEVWKTEGWKQAVDRGDPWWVPSRAMASVAGSRSEMRERR